MRQSILFGKTTREIPTDEVSVNARLLTRAGYVDKLMAGVYSFLPLGMRVLQNIAEIIREEINAIGGQELLLPALHPKENWEKTGRWSDPGREVMFQLRGRGDRQYGLGWTHEEIITPLAARSISSYRDLPRALYQIQTKFRDEARAKSGLLRGREFMMKDLYSFHADEDDLERYYDRVKEAYMKIFERCGAPARIVEASGGAFSKFSHEFQIVTPAGEDIIIFCGECAYAQNREIARVSGGEQCPKCGEAVEALRAIEVGNIFKLKTRFSEAFRLRFKDAQGIDRPVLMGCYGIGLGRLLGSIVEVQHDDKGIIWPESVAPYRVHLLALQTAKEVGAAADELYLSLQESGIPVLYDDRADASPGEKLNDADLIGIPWRAVISEKTAQKLKAEIKARREKEVKIITLKEVARYVQQNNGTTVKGPRY